MKYRYFNDAELACKCCGVNKMADSFMTKVEKLREVCGFPFTVTSGYRCSKHNLEAAHTGATGPHTTGHAIDLAIQGQQAITLVQKAAELGFTGFGISQKGSGRFIHLDDLTTEQGFPRPAMWSY